jgi:formylglycine-generating enzyme
MMRSLLFLSSFSLLVSPLASLLATPNDAATSLKNANAKIDDDDDEWGANLEDHPDPNDEHYDGMIYVGKHDENGRRLGFDVDNGFRFIFGTSFDESHKEIEEKDLLHHPLRPVHDIPEHEREQKLKERRHKTLTAAAADGKIVPKPFGYVEEHPLDGGAVPPKVVHVDPFFLDETLVTNKEFGKFVRATYYETEAEKYGWSFVLQTMVDPTTRSDNDLDHEVDPEANHWVAVEGAYWRQPEGPKSSYKYRENHPVVHVSHRDAAEYCKWAGKRLPGEWEWEAAARAGHYGPSNRTLFAWGDADDDWELASKHANLWGPGAFPTENDALDGFRATSPVKNYPPNALGFYDMTGNVWEWQRGGKHKARIVRGGSFVDSLDGSVNHAATLGARATVHATTTTANIGFRCAKAPKRRTEYHYVYHDEELHGQLAVEDQFGRRDTLPMQGWEDQLFWDDENEEELDDEALMNLPRQERKKKKVVKKRERFSNEL